MTKGYLCNQCDKFFESAMEINLVGHHYATTFTEFHLCRECLEKLTGKVITTIEERSKNAV